MRATCRNCRGIRAGSTVSPAPRSAYWRRSRASTPIWASARSSTVTAHPRSLPRWPIPPPSRSASSSAAVEQHLVETVQDHQGSSERAHTLAVSAQALQRDVARVRQGFEDLSKREARAIFRARRARRGLSPAAPETNRARRARDPAATAPPAPTPLRNPAERGSPPARSSRRSSDCRSG